MKILYATYVSFFFDPSISFWQEDWGEFSVLMKPCDQFVTINAHTCFLRWSKQARRVSGLIWQIHNHRRERTGFKTTPSGIKEDLHFYDCVCDLSLWQVNLTKTKSRSLGHISPKIKTYCVKSVSINGNAINKAVLLQNKNNK